MNVNLWFNINCIKTINLPRFSIVIQTGVLQLYEVNGSGKHSQPTNPHGRILLSRNDESKADSTSATASPMRIKMNMYRSPVATRLTYPSCDEWFFEIYIYQYRPLYWLAKTEVLTYRWGITKVSVSYRHIFLVNVKIPSLISIAEFNIFSAPLSILNTSMVTLETVLVSTFFRGVENF